jgi:hypothetical protein
MLFLNESIRTDVQEIANEIAAGSIDEVTGARRLLEINPQAGGPYLVMGNERLSAGDLDQAEAYFWEAVNRQPCEFTCYLALADVRRRRDAADPMDMPLRLLALKKLATAKHIRDEAADHFRNHLGERDDLDFKDPETYELLIAFHESQNKDTEESPEVTERLLPYRLLHEVQQGADILIPAASLNRIREDPAGFAPLFHAALREWGRNPDSISSEGLSLIVAVLGEIADADVLGDLLELSSYDDVLIFWHAQWAIFRLGQRFPAGALAAFRAAIPWSSFPTRCTIADQLCLLPQTDDLAPTYFSLLNGFAKFAGREDAPHLLAAVAFGLASLNRDRDVLEAMKNERLLSKEGRKHLRKLIDSEDGFVPTVIRDGIDELDIEQICLSRALLDDEEDEEDEIGYEDLDDLDEDDLDYEDDLDQVQPIVKPPKPGRNDPCWCGSGKKYKKCHLDADEKSARAGGAGIE